MRVDRLAAVTQLADAVLYEGYMLYPYRKSAIKNQMRWQFGVVAPRRTDVTVDDWFVQSDVVVEPFAGATIGTTIRFLQLQTRTVEVMTENGWEECDRVVIDGQEVLSWQEAEPCEITAERVALELLSSAEHTAQFLVEGGSEIETLRDASGAVVARVRRARDPLALVVRRSARAISEAVKVSVRVENAVAFPQPAAASVASAISSDKDASHSLIGCHAILSVENGAFASLLDPTPRSQPAAATCTQHRWWPVLVGSEDARDLLLCAPIILPDYPAVAPESEGDFFDATEIDELLTLRILTLTPGEKLEMAASDERARRLLERIEHSAPAVTAQLHGAIRGMQEGAPRAVPSWDSFVNPPDLPPPEQAFVDLGTTRIMRGSRVRIAPRGRADAMDMFLAGRVATVAGVYQDVDERTHVAVTLEDDPSADLHLALGRFFYFAPDELVPLEEIRGG